MRERFLNQQGGNRPRFSFATYVTGGIGETAISPMVWERCESTPLENRSARGE
jgi:hypothetical protein